jgi:hypothetical protein
MRSINAEEVEEEPSEDGGDDEVRDGVEEARRRLQGHGGADH